MSQTPRIDDQFRKALPSETKRADLRTYFSYMKQFEDSFWVAPFGDGTKAQDLIPGFAGTRGYSG